MTFFIAHAGEDPADAPITASETNNADILLPVIIITLVFLAALATVAILLSQKKKTQPKTTGLDETE